MPMLASAAGQTPACYSSASQGGLDACAAGEYSKADSELNAVWKAILVKYADQPAFLSKLKTSQRLWIKFRDAEIDAMYPVGRSEDPDEIYGSAYPMCISQAETRLTEQRIKQLKAWLDGAAEGDVCAGSIKNSSDLK
jgi:uncharacterized protein YecT (DUF1311 family)